MANDQNIMYKIPHFTTADDMEVKAFMEAHPFVTLIGVHNNSSVATQIPVMMHEKDGELILSCHIMRATDHYKAIIEHQEVLLLFQGPQCYVSSSWYTEKIGATWNYQTVHVRGNCSIMTDEETMQLLTELTARFEAGQETPLYTEQLPYGYMPAHIKAIAGLEIKVTSIYPIFKLSQNRDDTSYKNIVHHLGSSADADAQKLAAEMVQRRPHLF